LVCQGCHRVIEFPCDGLEDLIEGVRRRTGYAITGHLVELSGLCTIFAETTASARLAQTVSEELAGCDEVAVLQLYTGALGPPGSGADSYVGMLRYNVDTIVEGLR
jgi:hypothetical protein